MLLKLATLVALSSSTLATVCNTSFVLVGDSTTANATTLNAGGWGNGFCGSTYPEFETPSSLRPDVVCINTAKNGATTGTFVANGYWAIAIAAVKAEIAQGKTTYVTIQFGHNDQKIATVESYGTNLTAMVVELKALGAKPVVVTSLTRRSFVNGTVSDTLQPWADKAIAVASEQGVKSIDLHAKSIAYVEAIGADAAHRLNRSPDDNTHLNTFGSIVFGRMVADLLKAAYRGPVLPIIANHALTYNITHGIASY